MKKMTGLILSVGLLAACSPSESTDEETLTQEEEAAVDEETQVGEAAATDEEMSAVEEEDLGDAEMITNLDNYEEFAEQDAFDPSQFDTYLITDNQATRVVLFMEDEEQVYKSTYIKEDSRFKVVDLRENELILNAPL